MLEGKIKQQKAMAPKGRINAKTWQRVSQSLDKVEAFVTNTKSSLGIKKKMTTRNILLEEKINNWQTLL